MKKSFWVLDFFVSDVVSGEVLGLFGLLHLALGPNRYMVVFRCWFLLETRLNSKSFDTLDDLLGFGFKSHDLKTTKSVIKPLNR